MNTVPVGDVPTAERAGSARSRTQAFDAGVTNERQEACQGSKGVGLARGSNPSHQAGVRQVHVGSLQSNGLVSDKRR